MSSEGSVGWAVRLYKQDFRFDAAHFLVFGDGTREPLHGHNYQVSVRLEGDVGPDDLEDGVQAGAVVRVRDGSCDLETLGWAHGARW